MNREKAQGILDAYGNPITVIGDTKVAFARETSKTVEEIESKSNEEIIEEWKDLAYVNIVSGNVSLREMQRMNLLELEMNERDIPIDFLQSWLNNEIVNFDEC